MDAPGHRRRRLARLVRQVQPGPARRRTRARFRMGNGHSAATFCSSRMPRVARIIKMLSMSESMTAQGLESVLRSTRFRERARSAALLALLVVLVLVLVAQPPSSSPPPRLLLVLVLVLVVLVSSSSSRPCPRSRRSVLLVVRELAAHAEPAARKLLDWPTRCKLAHAFLWKNSYKRLELAQLLGQLGVFLTAATSSTAGQWG
jgi:hypothetical protein